MENFIQILSHEKWQFFPNRITQQDFKFAKIFHNGVDSLLSKQYR